MLLNEVESELVKPFYLKMMGLNGLRTSDETWERLIGACHTITTSEVSWMLRTRLWRPVVMGAWFSLVVPARQIEDDLVASMAQSQGSLTAPPLAGAGTLVAGTAAVPAMLSCLGKPGTQNRFTRGGSLDQPSPIA